MQIRSGLPHTTFLLHWDNGRYDRLTASLLPSVDLQGGMAGGLVEVDRSRREPVQTLPLPQRLLSVLGFAGLGIGGILLLLDLLPLTLLVVTVFCTIVTPLGMLHEARRNRPSSPVK